MSLNSSKFYAFFAFFILIFTGCADEKGSAFFNGYVEGDYLYVAPSVSGRIVNLSVKENAAIQEDNFVFSASRLPKALVAQAMPAYVASRLRWRLTKMS